MLSDKLTRNFLRDTDKNTCVIIDAMYAAQSMGKQYGTVTFGNLAELFCCNIFSHLKGYQTRIDIVFDDYTIQSIKSETREQRNTKNVK